MRSCAEAGMHAAIRPTTASMRRHTATRSNGREFKKRNMVGKLLLEAARTWT